MAPIIPFPNEIPPESVENNSDELPPLFLNVSDSYSDDDEEEDHDGYEPLSQDPENCLENHSDDMEEDNSFLAEEDKITIRCTSTFMRVDSSDDDDESDDETASSSKSDTKEDLEMDEDHIEMIKAVMREIKLPVLSYPEWAFNVSEEEWKSNFLSSKLQQKNDYTSSEFGEGPDHPIRKMMIELQNEIDRR